MGDHQSVAQPRAPVGVAVAHRPGGESEMKRRALRGAIASQRGRGLAQGEVGPLETHSDAKRWLRLIGEAVITGRLSNRDAQAGVKAVEAWLKAHGESIGDSRSGHAGRR